MVGCRPSRSHLGIDFFTILVDVVHLIGAPVVLDFLHEVIHHCRCTLPVVSRSFWVLLLGHPHSAMVILVSVILEILVLHGVAPQHVRVVELIFGVVRLVLRWEVAHSLLSVVHGLGVATLTHHLSFVVFDAHSVVTVVGLIVS